MIDFFSLRIDDVRSSKGQLTIHTKDDDECASNRSLSPNSSCSDTTSTEEDTPCLSSCISKSLLFDWNLNTLDPARGTTTKNTRRGGRSSDSSTRSDHHQYKDNTDDPPEMLHLQSMLCEEDQISEKSWLTSSFIDLMLLKFAMLYPDVYFLPTDFVPLHLDSALRNEQLGPAFIVKDILGRLVDYSSHRPLVFVTNMGQIHWNLFRLQHVPEPELQLFEPMGRPHSRNGVSARCIPRSIIEWLDTCFPSPTSSWFRKTVSAITQRHQYSGFDCGVACLLYAAKCGQGQVREDINELTDQMAITSFRKELQMHLQISLVSNEHHRKS